MQKHAKTINQTAYRWGSDMADLIFDFSALTFFAVMACLLAAITYRKRG